MDASSMAIMARSAGGRTDTYLVIQVRAGERARWHGRGGQGVHGLQHWRPLDADLSAGHGGHPQGWRRQSEPGLGTEPPETSIRLRSE